VAPLRSNTGSVLYANTPGAILPKQLSHSKFQFVKNYGKISFFLLLKFIGDHYVSQPNCLDINRPIKLKVTARKLFLFDWDRIVCGNTELVTNIRQRQNTNLFNTKNKSYNSTKKNWERFCVAFDYQSVAIGWVTVQDITFSFSLDRIANDFITALKGERERERERGRERERERERAYSEEKYNRYCRSNIDVRMQHSLHRIHLFSSALSRIAYRVCGSSGCN